MHAWQTCVSLNSRLETRRGKMKKKKEGKVKWRWYLVAEREGEVLAEDSPHG